MKGEKLDQFHPYPISWEQISNYPKELREKIIKEIISIDNFKKS